MMAGLRIRSIHSKLSSAHPRRTITRPPMPMTAPSMRVRSFFIGWIDAWLDAGNHRHLSGCCSASLNDGARNTVVRYGLRTSTEMDVTSVIPSPSGLSTSNLPPNTSTWSDILRSMRRLIPPVPLGDT